MVRLRKTILIKAPPDRVWATLGDLEAATKWVPGIATARMEGTRRVCRTHDGFEIIEEISDYSREGRSWSYKQLQIPVPIRNSWGTMRVFPDEGGSRVAWEAEFDPLELEREREVASMLSGYYDETLASLRKCVEATPR